MKIITISIGIVLALGIVGGGVWFYISQTSKNSTPTQTTNELFGNSGDVPVNGAPLSDTGSSTTQTITTPSDNTQQKIFKISDGPVVSATLIQTLHPTTTIARYINQNDGHAFDMPLDVPGAVPRIVSNITIPGGVRALWVEGGNSAVMQYLDGALVKTVYLGFPPATTSTKTLPTKILFLPDAIADIAASPDGKSVAYLLKTASGVDGYTAKADGTGSKKLFSLPLSQVLISWPAPNNLLLGSKSSAGTPGILFSVDVKTGGTVPLVYTEGATAIADRSFSQIMYQTVQTAAEKRNTYLHNVKTGLETQLAFSPFPERCIWSLNTAAMLYCANPVLPQPLNYLDLWHQGAASAVDAIFTFNTTTGQMLIAAIPGSDAGGVDSDILEMALSPDERYLSFVNKGQRTLWAVRLFQ